MTSSSVDLGGGAVTTSSPGALPHQARLGDRKASTAGRQASCRHLAAAGRSYCTGPKPLPTELPTFDDELLQLVGHAAGGLTIEAEEEIRHGRLPLGAECACDCAIMKNASDSRLQVVRLCDVN